MSLTGSGGTGSGNTTITIGGTATQNISPAQSFTAPRKPRAPKKQEPGTLRVDHGVATLKAYPLTEDDLENLGWFDAATTFFFSAATLLGTECFDINRDLALASGLTKGAIGYYSALAVAFGVGALFLAIIGAVLVVLRLGKIGQIKKRTKFSDDLQPAV